MVRSPSYTARPRGGAAPSGRPPPPPERHSAEARPGRSRAAPGQRTAAALGLLSASANKNTLASLHWRLQSEVPPLFTLNRCIHVALHLFKATAQPQAPTATAPTGLSDAPARARPRASRPGRALHKAPRGISHAAEVRKSRLSAVFPQLGSGRGGTCSPGRFPAFRCLLPVTVTGTALLSWEQTLI